MIKRILIKKSSDWYVRTWQVLFLPWLYINRDMKLKLVKYWLHIIQHQSFNTSRLFINILWTDVHVHVYINRKSFAFYTNSSNGYSPCACTSISSECRQAGDATRQSLVTWPTWHEIVQRYLRFATLKNEWRI